ncbi:radical SAM protein [Bacteriovorax sp. Seq25_V]|uniref:B12-binding domain-containing radical SAM protein n=1 Tax=Bacteriovorax sp. Seq25_V TaxID=1201288 RepID=UPI00038A5361|nr:radical SAM protein [Bacteriovorax sp. Seq25_V]EQC46914.1 radical SAM domain protein [Bacteriovorax sp. Seq25_V]
MEIITFIRIENKEFELYQLQGLMYPPMWAVTLNSYLMKEFSQQLKSELVDLRIQEFKEIKPSSYYCLSGMNQDLHVLAEVADKLRKLNPRAKILLGGPITWSFEQEGKLSELNFADHIFIGDGEVEFVEYFKKDFAKINISRIINAETKFNLSDAIAFDEKLFSHLIPYYSGGCVEVSRGCPFLCEFCDIRVMPDNNRSHCKSIDVIMDELKVFQRSGLNFVFMACDNFNGDVKWAERLCDEIIKWRAIEDVKISFYTWSTINICYHPNLLKKMRLAGIDTLFIGIESFHQNSLLETSKVQNTKLDLIEANKLIQSYGFILYAGLIMGFDNDPEDIASIQLEGLEKSGLISGDITPLLALPGTPLYKRLKDDGRLRVHQKSSLGYKRYSSNIIFNRPTDVIKKQLKEYLNGYNRGTFQRRRYINFLKSQLSEQRIDSKTGDYASLSEVFKIVIREPAVLLNYIKRMMMVFINLERAANFIFASAYTLYFSIRYFNCMSYFKFWLFAWTTSLLKSLNIPESEIDLQGNHEIKETKLQVLKLKVANE